ncbi:hypothetical protein AKJ09_08418 [Labilithrix luteola]|uniref:Lipoprotein n=1 Tax=Labilithrix luteola TaxID=1391654 RepID=A0A0K1Q8P2_9BACT|nr:hypothetical protein AKJ09_08418 [Labilithrix luteola]
MFATAGCTLAVFALIRAVGACSSPYGEATATANDAAPSAADSQDARGVPDPCQHAFVAEPPDNDDAPDEVLPPFGIAVDAIQVQGNQENPLALDLDNVCTCETGAGTAHEGKSSCITAASRCDLDGGRDNAVGEFVSGLGAFYAVDKFPNALIQQGRRGVLTQLGKYNGRANDKDVALGIILSEGIHSQGCPNSTAQHGTTWDTWSPGWCGDDKWSLPRDGVFQVSSGAVFVVVGTGYVRDYQLVVNFEKSTVSVPFDDAYALLVSSAIITGKLVPLGEDMNPRDPSVPPRTDKEKRFYRVDDGVLAGRISTHDLLAAIGSSKQSQTVEQTCLQSLYPVLKDRVCSSADIARSADLDFQPDAGCDALSTAIRFTGKPALLGEVYDRNRPSTPCEPGPNGEPLDAGVSYLCP